jgi:SulP family sulfate permease
MKSCFAPDLKAGAITAIVALPLAIAFALASGVTPVMGLYTAIIAGILGSLFGGSPFSITGPTGAMSIIILATMQQYGLSGLLLAGFLAGVIQIILGVLRLGSAVKMIPLSVVTGFTSGIGILIFVGQLENALGLSLPPTEYIWQKIPLIFSSLSQVNTGALILTGLTLLCVIFLPHVFAKMKMRWLPPSFLALALTTLAVIYIPFAVPTIGNIVLSVPKFAFPDFSLFFDVLPASFTIALLGSIEALLCAVVADNMSSTKHRSNKELVAQGVCNIVVPFAGAIPATAAIARTAVNIREGAKTRMAGVFHALFLMAIVLFLAPVAAFVPKAFLAGVLLYVSFRMVDVSEIKTVFSANFKEGLIVLVTIGLTFATDLVFAVQVGMLAAVVLLFWQMRENTYISYKENYSKDESLNKCIADDPLLKDSVAMYTIHGPLFFGAITVFDSKISEHMDMAKPYIIIRLKHVTFIDATAIAHLKSFVKHRLVKGNQVYFSRPTPLVKEKLLKEQVIDPKFIVVNSRQALELIKVSRKLK